MHHLKTGIVKGKVQVLLDRLDAKSISFLLLSLFFLGMTFVSDDNITWFFTGLNAGAFMVSFNVRKGVASQKHKREQ